MLLPELQKSRTEQDTADQSVGLLIFISPAIPQAFGSNMRFRITAQQALTSKNFYSLLYFPSAVSQFLLRFGTQTSLTLNHLKTENTCRVPLFPDTLSVSA